MILPSLPNQPKRICLPEEFDQLQKRIWDFWGGGANLLFRQSFRKLHGNEENWTVCGGEGVRPKLYYVDPPLNYM